jgi:hypothetical protein
MSGDRVIESLVHRIIESLEKQSQNQLSVVSHQEKQNQILELKAKSLDWLQAPGCGLCTRQPGAAVSTWRLSDRVLRECTG